MGSQVGLYHLPCKKGSLRRQWHCLRKWRPCICVCPSLWGGWWCHWCCCRSIEEACLLTLRQLWEQQNGWQLGVCIEWRSCQALHSFWCLCPRKGCCPCLRSTWLSLRLSNLNCRGYLQLLLHSLLWLSRPGCESRCILHLLLPKWFLWGCLRWIVEGLID